MHIDWNALADFSRQFRRPFGSMVCATAFAGSGVAGAITGNWMPAGLAWVFAAVIGIDTTARAVEKIQQIRSDEE